MNLPGSTLKKGDTVAVRTAGWKQEDRRFEEGPFYEDDNVIWITIANKGAVSYAEWDEWDLCWVERN